MVSSSVYYFLLCAILWCRAAFSDGQSARGDQLLSSEFWKLIAPEMHIYDAQFSNSLNFLLTENGTANYLRELMKTEGYIQLDPVVFSPMDINSMVQTIERLHAAGLPLPFAYIYDEFWLIFVALHHVITAWLFSPA